MAENNNVEFDVGGKTKETTESDDTENESAAANFDTAIEAAGFGTFNILLLAVAVPAMCANMFESSSMSYILPIAECDLELSLTDKGILNAVAYGGMIVSAVAWGYLADTKGRRKVLVYGYLADSICVLGSALSQNFIMLVLFKFLGGLIINGPAAVLFTYLTEFHGPKHRSHVLMILGMITSVAMLGLPMLAWGIFPRDWEVQLFNSFNIHTWQIYLFCCAAPSIISGLLLLLFPESPKFLMGQGRNAEALQVLQKIYAVNTGKPKDSYKIQTLIEEVPSRDALKDEVIYTIEEKSTKPATKPQSRSWLESLRAGMQQIKPMVHKPLLGLSMRCYTMQFCIFLGMNTIRLWLPQLFASMSEYESAHVGDDAAASMCTILDYSVNRTAETILNHKAACAEPKHISMDMYMNNIIVSVTGLVGYFFAGAIVRALGAKKLLTFGLFISGTLGLVLYWSVNSLMTIIVSSAFVTVAGISTSSLLGAVVALFPTQLRSLVVAIAMMCGRLGALSGNLLFPVFIQIGCMPPFLMVCSVMICAAVLSIFLPNPSKVVFS